MHWFSRSLQFLNLFSARPCHLWFFSVPKVSQDHQAQVTKYLAIAWGQFLLPRYTQEYRMALYFTHKSLLLLWWFMTMTSFGGLWAWPIPYYWSEKKIRIALFAGTTMTKYHSLGGLNHRIYFITVLEARNLSSSDWQSCFLPRPSLAIFFISSWVFPLYLG